MTEEEKKKWRDLIDGMSQFRMGHLFRYSRSHVIFDSTNGLYNYFMKSFKAKGGMTSDLSKELSGDRE